MKRGGTGTPSKRAFHRALAAAAIMVSGLLCVTALEASLKLTLDKPPRALNKPLPLLSRTIGHPARYVAEGLDGTLEPGIVETLGTKEYLLRTYVDQTKKASEVGRALNLNLNYYGSGSTQMHVPEICWAGAGMEQAPSSKDEFDVTGVRRKSGEVVTIRMRMISFIPTHSDAAGLGLGIGNGEDLLNVAYFFEVNGKPVAKPGQVLDEFWHATNKYAYHTKIEVTVPAYCRPEQAQAVIADFIRASLADIEDCLPDPEEKAAPTGQPPSAGTVEHPEETR
jgi:hypothetical protein